MVKYVQNNVPSNLNLALGAVDTDVQVTRLKTSLPYLR